MPTIYLGVVAILKALLPMMLKFVATDSSAQMTGLWNPGAGLLWWIGNLLVWFPLTIMWPLTYSGTLVTPYLFLTHNFGIWGGAILALINAITFGSAIGKDTKASLYLALVALIDVSGVVLTWLFYNDVEAYLTWQEAVEPAEEVIEIVKKEEIVEEIEEIVVVIEPEPEPQP